MTHELVELRDGGAILHPHTGQRASAKAKQRFVFVIAGTQSGKTSWGPWWLAYEIKRCGPGDYLAVTATFDLFKLKMLPEMRQVFTTYLPDWEWVASDRLFWRKEDKSRIILRSANAPEGLESATAKAAWLDECGQDTFRLESWEAVLRRLALNQGRCLGTTTPYNLGWLKVEVYDKWRAGDPDMRVIQFKSTMNPAFPEQEYQDAKRRLPGWKFEMFYNGEFTRPAGLIYGDLDEKVHLVKPFDIPPEWPRYVGVDFGAVHTAIIWIAEDPNKQVYYAYREYLEGERTTQQHAKAALRASEKENVVIWAGGAKSEQQQRWDWQSNGVPLSEPIFHEVELGIDRVIELLKTKRLFVFNTCRGLLDEFGTYSREVDEFGQPTEKIKDKEKFHRLDALRYAAQQINNAGVFFA